MEHLKVKGWGFYNSIGRKAVEREKERVRVEMDEYFKSKTCRTCKYLNNENNYCSIIDQFNDVEFGCINHCS